MRSSVSSIGSQSSDGDLIIIPRPLLFVNRELIVGLAAQYRLPAIYPFGFSVTAGGLMSWC
jgi:hypothetical protein